MSWKIYSSCQEIDCSISEFYYLMIVHNLSQYGISSFKELLYWLSKISYIFGQKAIPSRGDQLTLSQTGLDYAHHITTGFSDLPTALLSPYIFFFCLFVHTVANNSYHFWADLLHKWSSLGMTDIHEYIRNAMPSYYNNQFSMGYI